VALVFCGFQQVASKLHHHPVKINVRDGKRYTVPTHACDMLLPREKAEVLEAYHVIVDPGRFTPKHVHPDMEQLYFVTGGAGKIVLTSPQGEETSFTLGKGDTLYIPRNTSHQGFCTSKDALTYFCVDAFPDGKPANEPTWDDHLDAVRKTLFPNEKK
jgi:mannose-6-phosphate isomerase-like protein (cupin superfamily)